MAFKLVQLGRLVAVRWGDTTPDEVQQVAGRLQTARAKLRQQLVYISISGDDTPPPDEHTRRAIVRAGEDLVPLCELFVVVIESQGFRGSMLRSALAGMLLLSSKRKQVRVCESTEDALLLAAPLLSEAAASLRSKLAQAGIVADAPPSARLTGA